MILGQHLNIRQDGRVDDDDDDGMLWSLSLSLYALQKVANEKKDKTLDILLRWAALYCGNVVGGLMIIWTRSKEEYIEYLMSHPGVVVVVADSGLPQDTRGEK